MKRGLSLVAIVLLSFGAGVAGCAHGHYVVAPDGQAATVVTCHHRSQHNCYVKAQRICPWGFEVLDAPYGSLLIRCGSHPGAPAPPPGQDQQDQQQPQQNAPAAPESTPPVSEEKLYRT